MSNNGNGFGRSLGGVMPVFSRKCETQQTGDITVTIRAATGTAATGATATGPGMSDVDNGRGYYNNNIMNIVNHVNALSDAKETTTVDVRTCIFYIALLVDRFD